MIFFDKEETESGKYIMEKEKNKKDYEGENYNYLEDIWLREVNNDFFIKRIMINYHNNECYIFKNEISFMLDNFRVNFKDNKAWDFTIYIYTNAQIYYANGIKNNYSKFFNVTKLY